MPSDVRVTVHHDVRAVELSEPTVRGTGNTVNKIKGVLPEPARSLTWTVGNDYAVTYGTTTEEFRLYNYNHGPHRLYFK